MRDLTWDIVKGIGILLVIIWASLVFVVIVLVQM